MKTYNMFMGMLLALVLSSCQSKLVSSGQSDYDIVALGEEKSAALELQNYLAKMTGVTLPISTEVSEKSIIISQKDQLKEHAHLVEGINLEEQGIMLKNHKDQLWLIGGSEEATSYAVYELLELLGCRTYSSTVQHIPSVESIDFPELNLVHNPKITYRDVLYTDAKTDIYSKWHKLHVPLIGKPRTDWGYWCHSFFNLIDPEEHFDSHPEYFAEVNGTRIPSTQLCTTNDEMIEVLIANLGEEMKLKPEAKYWSVSQQDTYGWCRCEKCEAINKREETPMGSILYMVNKIAERYPDHVISTLAYEYSRKPPKHMKPLDNVNIMLCSIECNRSQDIASDPRSADFMQEVKDWDKISDNILVWDYVIQFKHLLSPFPNFHVLQPNLKFFADHGGVGEFQQGNREIGGEFAELRNYLISKLMWNPDLDMDVVYNDFMDGYYEDAAPYLKDYIRIMTETLQESGERLDIFGSPIGAENSYLTPALLSEYETLFEQAEVAVGQNEDVLKRVKAARLGIQYARLEQAKAHPFEKQGWFEQKEGQWVVKASMKTLLEEFTQVANTEKVTRVHEWDTTVDEYYDETMAFISRDTEGNHALDAEIKGSEPAEKYAHNGLSELHNGIKGTADWSIHWLGYEGQDLEYVLDLGSEKALNTLECNFMQDMGSWIFRPSKVSAYVAGNEGKYSLWGSSQKEVSKNAPKINNYTITGKTKARYVKVKVNVQKTCPDWHIGVGNAAWTFIDEISVK